MTSYVALLRAVNVGGTGKLSMTDLRGLCETIGWRGVRTYIASGNVVFHGEEDERAVVAALEAALLNHLGKPVGVLARTGEAMAAVLAANPFPAAPASRTAAIFLHEPPPADLLARASGLNGERIVAGLREIYVLYPEGMARSKLRIPAARTGTARNMNTVARLAEWARG